jgi:hypothetical protein
MTTFVRSFDHTCFHHDIKSSHRERNCDFNSAYWKIISMAKKICRVTGTTHIFFLLCVLPKYLKVANFAFRWKQIIRIKRTSNKNAHWRKHQWIVHVESPTGMRDPSDPFYIATRTIPLTGTEGEQWFVRQRVGRKSWLLLWKPWH